ncbi:unnamed protein product (macronuclear) [Paramecium tetraurelia]|uniref:C2H2-type domain-containing protein n=1 Tax=Paramecium tetraurelia TaxID=5888 RepID=A0BMY2_PARTE|nr:uncharacterized protein GSPATT00030536001 [Paramecium tetraurelia]CAK59899.1 unnamed protein product [Paramecium tetraurelia]|eukprot:XP_001427297.1 hypothetical protein (macronuclear) [Paramecium tetraurelia strain d4-2]
MFYYNLNLISASQPICYKLSSFMNESIRSTLKKVLEMQLDCTQILTTILFKNNDTNKDVEIRTTKQLLEEQRNQIDAGDQKRKKTLLNNEKSLDMTKQKNSDQPLIQDTNVQLSFSPEECYSKLNNMISEFRERNSLATKILNFDFEYIKEYHSRNKFKELRSKVKLVINRIQNKRTMISIVNGKRIYQCPSCNFQGFSSVYYPHILKKHCQNYYIFCCFLCQQDFSSFTVLKKHLKKYHMEALNTSSDIEIIRVQQDENENDLSISI